MHYWHLLYSYNDWILKKYAIKFEEAIFDKYIIYIYYVAIKTEY